MPESPQGHSSASGDRNAAIGERIRRARLHQGLTLRDLAAGLQVSPSTMSAIENGHTAVSAIRLAQIAALVSVTLDELFSGNDTPAVPARPLQAAAAQRSTPGAWRTYEPAHLDAPLQAALEAFLEIGYHGATVRDIARRAGLSVPGIYHHYASKQEMLVSILDGALDELVWRYEAALAEADGVLGKFRNAVESMVLFHTNRRDWAFLGRSEQRSLADEAASTTRERRLDAEHSLIGIIEQGCEAGIFSTTTPSVAGRAVIMMCVGTVYWYREDGPDAPSTIARQYIDLALRMVGFQEVT